MKPSKIVTTRTTKDLARALGLHPAEGAAIRLRSELNSKIIAVVTHKKLTHAQVARLAHTSRTRITAIMNRNTIDISTDLMLRVLFSLGYKATIKFHHALQAVYFSKTLSLEGHERVRDAQRRVPG